MTKTFAPTRSSEPSALMKVVLPLIDTSSQATVKFLPVKSFVPLADAAVTPRLSPLIWT